MNLTRPVTIRVEVDPDMLPICAADSRVWARRLRLTLCPCRGGVRLDSWRCKGLDRVLFGTADDLSIALETLAMRSAVRASAMPPESASFLFWDDRARFLTGAARLAVTDRRITGLFG